MKGYLVETRNWSGLALGAAEFDSQAAAGAAARRTFARSRGDVRAVVVLDPAGVVVLGLYFGSGGARVEVAGGRS